MVDQLHIVYFSRKSATVSMSENQIIFPWRYKRVDVLKQLAGRINLFAIDVVIVRNLFKVLNRVLPYRNRFGFLVGFWESFPHNFRRVYQARIEHKHVFRKTIEYHFKQKREESSLKKCDFYLPITDTYKTQFYKDLHIPFHPLPMGVDFSRVPVKHPPAEDSRNGVHRFVYIGAVDRMRQLDVVVSAFLECNEKFEFHIYTPSINLQVNEIRNLAHPRILVRENLPRTELFNNMVHYNVGIGLVPESPLYIASSPTKTLEYYALGLPAIINNLPEYKLLFDSQTAFLSEFTQKSIAACIRRICRTPKEEIGRMGALGRERVRKERDYAALSTGLFDFFNRLLHDRTVAHNRQRKNRFKASRDKSPFWNHKP